MSCYRPPPCHVHICRYPPCWVFYTSTRSIKSSIIILNPFFPGTRPIPHKNKKRLFLSWKEKCHTTVCTTVNPNSFDIKPFLSKNALPASHTKAHRSNDFFTKKDTAAKEVFLLHPDWLAKLFVDRSHFSLLPRCCYTTETVEKKKSSCVSNPASHHSPQNQKVVYRKTINSSDEKSLASLMRKTQQKMYISLWLWDNIMMSRMLTIACNNHKRLYSTPSAKTPIARLKQV